jgi:hypothetical protein
MIISNLDWFVALPPVTQVVLILAAMVVIVAFLGVF